MDLIFLHGRMILGSCCDFQVTCLPSYCPIREQQYDIICIGMWASSLLLYVSLTSLLATLTGHTWFFVMNFFFAMIAPILWFPQRQMREYLIRLIYCEMLGVECSWGYIHAVKFTQRGSTMDKRIGQLVSCPVPSLAWEWLFSFVVDTIGNRCIIIACEYLTHNVQHIILISNFCLFKTILRQLL